MRALRWLGVFAAWLISSALTCMCGAPAGCAGRLEGVEAGCDDASTDAHMAPERVAHADSGDAWTGLVPLGDWPCLQCPPPTGRIHTVR